MASGSAEVYNTDRFAELYYGSRHPPIENLGLAAWYLCSLFGRHSIPFAFLGGWAIYLRGGPRQTEDVDITVRSSMLGLKAILMLERRICVPQTHGATCIQIFVHTGSSWEPGRPDADAYTISIDIIINGNLGTPPDIPNGTEMLLPVPPTSQGRSAVPVLDIYYQITCKLQAHFGRRATGSSNDYTDLVFLVWRYPTEIWSFREYLNQEHRRTFYDDFAAANEQQNAHFVAEVLGLRRGSF